MANDIMLKDFNFDIGYSGMKEVEYAEWDK